MGHEAYPRPFLAYATAIFLFGLAAAVATLQYASFVFTIQLALLFVAVLLSEEYALRLGAFSVSLTLPLVLATLFVGGPSAALIASLLSFTNRRELMDGRPLSVHALNAGQALAAASLAGWIYMQLGSPSVMEVSGAPNPLGAAEVPYAILVALVCAAAFAVTNAVLVALGLHLGLSLPLAVVLRDMAQNLSTQIALTLVGVLMAQVLAISPAAFPLFLFPLFLARDVYRRYAELRDAYVDALRSLVGALEAKDPYTRGHSERVAVYALGLSNWLGLDSRACSVVERAALLHDIGKLGLPASLLAKPDSLSETENDAVRKHPATGADMLQSIPPLAELADLVESHHERHDGAGYPKGRRGEEIPYASRILTLADAFDAMTTNRAYRKALSRSAALQQLEEGAGSQFDPALAEAFIEWLQEQQVLDNAGELASGRLTVSEGTAP